MGLLLKDGILLINKTTKTYEKTARFRKSAGVLHICAGNLINLIIGNIFVFIIICVICYKMNENFQG